MLENGFLGGAIVMMIFLLIYTLIKIVNFKALKIYFTGVEIIILWIMISYFMKNEELDLAVLILLVFWQGMLIYFIKVDYQKDLYHQNIYLKISQSHFIPLIVMGIPDVKKENIDEFIKLLDDLFRNSDKMKKRAFCFFEYEEGYIKFHALFLRKSDMYLFVENKELLELNIEEVGKGGSIQFELKFDV